MRTGLACRRTTGAALAHARMSQTFTAPPPPFSYFSQVDLQRLRRLAAVRGLGTHALRARAWPLLLGAAPPSISDAAALEALATRHHKDRSVVDCDVARSLWSFTEGWGEGRREDVRAGLRRVLNAAVAAGGGGGVKVEGVGGGPTTPAATTTTPPPPPPPSAPPVHYYQGLHDVASVLLLVTGSEAAAFRLLTRLTVGPLRDCTRPTLAPALAAVGLLPALLSLADPPLAAHLAPTPPHYALPWHLTWFAHGMPAGPGALTGAARLFDLFAATHPLMPLYVGAALLTSPASRAALLATDRGDPGEVHGAIGRLPRLGGLSPDAAAVRALELYRAHPPSALVAAAAAAGAPRERLGRWLRRRGPVATPTPPPASTPQEDGSAAAGARLGGGGFWEVGDWAAAPPAPSLGGKPGGSGDFSGGLRPPLRTVSSITAGLAVLALTVATAALSARGGAA